MHKDLHLPHNSSLIPIQQFCALAKTYSISKTDRNGFGMETVKERWENSLEQDCMFVLVELLQNKSLECHKIISTTNYFSYESFTIFLRIFYQQVRFMII
jgi:hypothetical protein